jgi:GTP-binding protein
LSEAGEKTRDPLIVRSLAFMGGLAPGADWRPPIGPPEVAFSGRSNVGKSSLLNSLLRRKSAARVSQTPGKTREINFFLVNEEFYLVDLPGYGYARASHSLREGWGILIEHYLRTSSQLRGIVQLIDARRPATPDDVRMLDFLAELELPTVVALTKTDKLKPAERAEMVAELGSSLQLESDQVIPFSAVTGEGRDELAAALVALLKAPPWRST